MPILKNVHRYIFRTVYSVHYTAELFLSSKEHLGFPQKNASIPYGNTVTAKFHSIKNLKPKPGEKSCLTTTARLYIRHFSCMNTQMSTYVLRN